MYQYVSVCEDTIFGSIIHKYVQAEESSGESGTKSKQQSNEEDRSRKRKKNNNNNIMIWNNHKIMIIMDFVSWSRALHAVPRQKKKIMSQQNIWTEMSWSQVHSYSYHCYYYALWLLWCQNGESATIHPPHGPIQKCISKREEKNLCKTMEWRIEWDKNWKKISRFLARIVDHMQKRRTKKNAFCKFMVWFSLCHLIHIARASTPCVCVCVCVCHLMQSMIIVLAFDFAGVKLRIRCQKGYKTSMEKKVP